MTITIDPFPTDSTVPEELSAPVNPVVTPAPSAVQLPSNSNRFILVVIVVFVILVAALGMSIYLKNKSPKEVVIEQSQYTNLAPGIIELNQNYKFTENQTALIDGNADAFTLTSLVPCAEPSSNCGFNGLSLSWRIAANEQFFDGWCQGCISEISYSTRPPSPYKVQIVETDYNDYAVIRITDNTEYERELTEYLRQEEEERQKIQQQEEEEDKKNKELESSAKIVKFDQEFLVGPNEVIKIINDDETKVQLCVDGGVPA